MLTTVSFKTSDIPFIFRMRDIDNSYCNLATNEIVISMISGEIEIILITPGSHVLLVMIVIFSVPSTFLRTFVISHGRAIYSI